ncbi:MAG: exodeoxyribonuclease VII small subunit [Burkholderiaceae bacterium]|nr:exodeoxyribonuclease VII small subunit [Burkholderiaceae bacterium]
MTRSKAAAESPSDGADRADAIDAAEGGETDFEASMAELESIVDKMESGDLSLDASLAAYQRGAELVGRCRRSLARVQQQVKVLEADLLRAFEPDDDEQA